MILTPFRALMGVFAMNALGFAVWLPRIPDVREALGIDIFTLSLCLVAMPLGTITGLVFAADLVRRIGVRKSCIATAIAGPLLIIPPAFAPSALWLAGLLYLWGLTWSVSEVAINAMANAIQRGEGRRIMSRCHGVWSFGAMAGGLIGGAMSQAQIAPGQSLLIVEPFIIAAGVFFASRLPAGQKAQGGRSRFRLPGKALFVICLLPIGALMIEGAMLDWSVLYMREIHGTSAFAASAIFAVFNLAMGFGRLSGDYMTDRFGVERMMLVSGLSLGVGVAAFALAPGMEVAALAALLTGYGAANVYPLALSIAPDFPGPSPEQNVASVVIIAVAGFLVGPPLIGFVGAHASLPVAFLCLTPLGILPVVIVLRGLLTPPALTEESR